MNALPFYVIECFTSCLLISSTWSTTFETMLQYCSFQESCLQRLSKSHWSSSSRVLFSNLTFGLLLKLQSSRYTILFAPSVADSPASNSSFAPLSFISQNSLILFYRFINWRNVLILNFISEKCAHIHFINYDGIRAFLVYISVNCAMYFNSDFISLKL